MSTSKVAAQILVRAYLDGRTMDEFMFGAVVWMVDQRLTSGIVPALDQALRDDIDSQAGPVMAFKQIRGTTPYRFAVPLPQQVRWA